MERRKITVDANEAVAAVAYRTNEVIVIYPITPSSPMGEWCDEWAANGRTNLRGLVYEELAVWLETHECESLRQIQGSMGLLRCGNPAAYHRANYIRLLQSWSLT
jgi:hypothetical protein